MEHAPSFPREIADGIHWLGHCLPADLDGQPLHLHVSMFLLRGSKHTLLVDTGLPAYWPSVEQQIEKALGGRPLDFLFPTHPEVPHTANLTRILGKHPETKVVGDMRDYALFFPGFADRLVYRRADEEIDLGGLTFVFVDAPIKDLPNTLWGYERTHQMMFCSDGFSFCHGGPDLDADDDPDPVHQPGECALTSLELPGVVNENQASFVLRAALYWSRFVHPDDIFPAVERLFEKYPVKMLGPAHANVVIDLEAISPIVHAAHRNAFETGIALKY